MPAPVSHLSIEGFKSIRSLTDLRLGQMNILIGANGSGKSNFVAFFRLLSDIVHRRLQYAVGKGGGPEAYLHLGSKVTDAIVGRVYFGATGYEPALDGYEFALEPTTDNRMIFADDTLYLEGPGRVVLRDRLGAGQEESRLLQAYEGGPFRDVAAYVYPALAAWVVYHFHDTSDTARVKRRCAINDNERLRTDASNLAAFLHRLKAQEDEAYDKIRSVVRLAAPFFDDFKIRPMPDDEEQTQLEWTQRGSDYPFLARDLSDGTLRFICLVTALVQPDPPATLIVDEPELGLHPYALTLLAGLMREASGRAQVIASTQSATLLDHFRPEDVIVVERSGQESVFRSLGADELAEWLEDYTLGQLWQKNVFGGRPGQWLAST